jgi:malate dehydrogenase (oxaloacetate-decarboxylating)(NADP+)
VLSGFINAAKLSSAASGMPLANHRILFLGSGSAGVGVGMQLLSFFKLQGLSEAEAKNRIYYVDSQGLIYDARGPMQDHKRCKLPECHICTPQLIMALQSFPAQTTMGQP